MPPFPGTTGDDILYGTDDPDTMTGLAGNDRLFGFGGDDTLDGGDDSDILEGGSGADTMTGGAGDDFYVVDNFGDQVIELAGGGAELVFTYIDYILPDNVERLAVYSRTSTFAVALIGNALDNELIGNDGQNLLDGGEGQDIMQGASGDDQYVVSLQGTVTIGNQPSDSSLTDLGSTYLHSTAPDSVADSGGSTDTIWVPFTGSASAHDWFDYALLKGATFATHGIERLGVYDRTSTYAVNLQGDQLNNSIFANEGANLLDGWRGGDVLSGYGGDDGYFVDNRFDIVVESPGGGYDTVFLTRYPAPTVGNELTGGNYNLPSNVERLVALESATYASSLIGNDLANEIVGNSLGNNLSGGDSGTAADILRGGLGDDEYRLDYGTVPGSMDAVIELAGEGYDRVRTGFSYTLPDNVEELVGRDVLTGNELNNLIRGNEATNDTLDGRAGADTLIGGGGNDIYLVDDAGDAITELAGGGSDIVYTTTSYTLGSDVERVGALLLADTQSIDLTGNDLDNEIWGNAGANVLDGKQGVDILQGLGGADTFLFSSQLLGSGADQLVDFEVGIDKIALENAIFVGLAPGALPVGAFAIGSSAQDADDRIIYDASNGWLWFDRDGSAAGGVPIHFATLHEGLSLGATDFVVI